MIASILVIVLIFFGVIFALAGLMEVVENASNCTEGGKHDTRIVSCRIFGARDWHDWQIIVTCSKCAVSWNRILSEEEFTRTMGYHPSKWKELKDADYRR